MRETEETMKLWVWRPGLDAIDDLQRQMGRLMDWTFNVFEHHLTQGRQPLPSCNVYETPTEYQFLIPMPGVHADAIDVQVTGAQLTIKGERKRPEQFGDDQYRRQERWMGRWSRNLPLPERADPSQVQASFDHGVLFVQIAKQPESTPRQVAVKVAAGSSPSPGTHLSPVVFSAAERNGS
jgi:HSP20 family protein